MSKPASSFVRTALVLSIAAIGIANESPAEAVNPPGLRTEAREDVHAVANSPLDQIDIDPVSGASQQAFAFAASSPSPSPSPNARSAPLPKYFDEHELAKPMRVARANLPTYLDAPDALAQADVGVAMNTGTQAAKEAGNMIDLDSNPTKLIEVVEIGKQLLMTRGSLTTFSIANDVAKYFAIIPAMLVVTFPAMQALNIMRLHSPQSAILASVIFNALIIVALIPLALRGVRYRPASASVILRRNLFVYGVGGLVVPFIGIKAIDMALVFLHLV